MIFMKSHLPPKPGAHRFSKWRELSLVALLTAALAGLVVGLQPKTVPAGRPADHVGDPAVVQAGSPPAPSSTTLPEFRLRPLVVARHSGTHEWTSADGKNPDVIRQLAHNGLEYQRMVEENARIKRRQLVYRNETTAALVERNKLTGQPLQRLTLPGLDGQQVDVEITRADLQPSGQQGMFAGHVVGRDDSLVTLAFKGGREAFTILSPSDALFLQAEPREPGEVIVKSIDPDVYASGYCGNP